jgi:hypothetical protein
MAKKVQITTMGGSAASITPFGVTPFSVIDRRCGI